MRTYRCLPTLIILFAFALALPAQKALQIERYGSPDTEKFFAGDILVYRLAGEEHYQEGYIEGFRMEDSLIIFGDRYVNVHDIESLRFDRAWARAGGTSLVVFGLAWSGFAAVGYATDGDPETSYRWADAAVTGVSTLAGLGLRRFFKYKRVRLSGKRYRLRLVDLRFKVEGWED